MFDFLQLDINDQFFKYLKLASSISNQNSKIWFETVLQRSENPGCSETLLKLSSFFGTLYDFSNFLNLMCEFFINNQIVDICN